MTDKKVQIIFPSLAFPIYTSIRTIFFFVETLLHYVFLDAVSETNCVDVYVGAMFLAPSVVLPENSCLFLSNPLPRSGKRYRTPPCVTVNI